jgi:hypothetical protein
MISLKKYKRNMNNLLRSACSLDRALNAYEESDRFIYIPFSSTGITGFYCVRKTR